MTTLADSPEDARSVLGTMWTISVSQRSGSGVAEGFGFESVACSGSGEQVTVTVQAQGGKVFKKGTAVVTAEVFGCNEAVCGTETDTEVIGIQR